MRYNPKIPRKYTPSPHLCKSAGMPLTDNREHFFVVRCNHCPDWVETFDKRPIAAARTACYHAHERPGHSAYVIDVHKLTVVHRYEFETLTHPNGGDGNPPF